jgi:uncharacterized membrane protein
MNQFLTLLVTLIFFEVGQYDPEIAIFLSNLVKFAIFLCFLIKMVVAKNPQVQNLSF